MLLLTYVLTILHSYRDITTFSVRVLTACKLEKSLSFE